MADLKTLIRLHKHELDQKRQNLGRLYARLQALEQQKENLEQQVRDEQEFAASHFEAGLVYGGFAQAALKKKESLKKSITKAEDEIEKAKESLLESFAEMKKFEMTQAERDRLEEAERRLREGKMMDDIGLEGYRRKRAEE